MFLVCYVIAVEGSESLTGVHSSIFSTMYAKVIKFVFAPCEPEDSPLVSPGFTLFFADSSAMLSLCVECLATSTPTVKTQPLHSNVAE